MTACCDDDVRATRWNFSDSRRSRRSSLTFSSSSARLTRGSAGWNTLLVFSLLLADCSFSCCSAFRLLKRANCCCTPDKVAQQRQSLSDVFQAAFMRDISRSRSQGQNSFRTLKKVPKNFSPHFN